VRRKKQSRFVLIRQLLLLWLLVSATEGWAQSTPAGTPRTQTQATRTPGDSARILKEVIVKGHSLSDKDTSASPAQVLKGADLQKLNSLSVADAVRYFSGVQLKDYGGVGGLKTIDVRSLGTNHTGVFYDGVELGNAQNGQVDLGKFSLDNIEEIDLYDGQKATIFQPAAGFASGNALYLVGRQPDFSNGRRTIVKAAFKTGSFGLVDPSIFWQQKLSARVYASLSAETINANGKYKFNYTNGVYDTTAVRQNGDIAAQRLEGGLNGKGLDSSDWSVKGYLYNSARGLPGAIVSNNFTSDQRLWDRDYFFQGKYHKDWSRYSLMAIGKYANDYTRYLDPDYVTTTGLLDNRYHEQEAYASLAQRYRVNSWWSVALSSDFKWNTLDANLYHFAYPTRETILNALATEVRLPRLDIQGDLLSTVVLDQVKQYASPGNKTEWTPTVLASWQPFSSKTIHIRAFYKDIFRMPTFNDLYYTFVGNTFLQPEFAHQTDLGITYADDYAHGLLSHLSIQADAYYNLVTNKIVAVPGANLFRWTMMNLGKVSIKGLEVNAQALWILASNVRLTTGLSYTYEQALDITGGTDENYKQQIPYDPVNSGSALVGVDWRSLGVHYSFIYTGYRYDEAANIPANYLQPWYTHDLSLTYGMNVKTHSVKLTAEVNNIFNQYYDVIDNFPMPGRNYRCTLQFAW
jgi:outer membrane cobalamin receptor